MRKGKKEEGIRLGNKEGRAGRNKNRNKNKKAAQKGMWKGKK